MRILAFDTALEACSAAVLSVEGAARKLAHAYEPRLRGHAEALLPMIEQVMGEAGLAYGDLDRIAVTIGPGTFTGTRIGVATARGLALAIPAPLVGETTLAVMAQSAVMQGLRTPLAVAVDARRGQIYFQLFESAGGASGAPAVLPPDEAVGQLPPAPVTAVGSGAALIAEAAARRGLQVVVALPDLQPDAAALAELALTREPDGRPVAPLYLRPPDAKPQASALEGGAGA